MKCGFIRCIYGIYDDSHRLLARRKKIDVDIDIIKNNKYNTPFKVYIFGKDNYDRMVEKGFDCVLVNENPHPFDLIKHQYRNKMELILYALENDYDSVVYMDWDCIPTKPIPDDFWETNSKRGIFQACLQKYKNPKCIWRHNIVNDPQYDYIICRIVANGGWLYVREKSFMKDSISCWEEVGTPDNDEIGYARQMDKMTGGWMGQEHFWDNYESQFCNLRKMSPFSDQQLKSKNECFIHVLK